MTMDELEDTLPNGFHDSFLVSASVDYPAATACLEIDVDADDPDPEVFQRVKLKLKGLCLFIIDPPDLSQNFSFGDTEWINGDVTTEALLPKLEMYRQSVPAGSFFYSFFLRNWNSFIHVAAQDAELITDQ